MSSTPPESGSGSFREADWTPSGAPSAKPDWSDTATLPIAAIKDLFVTFSKAIRAVQLYDEKNPVYQRFVQSLRDALRDLWSDVDRLVMVVEEERFTVAGEEVYRAEIRACAALALGKIGTDQARKSLQAAGSEDDAVVRSAVNRALRGEESS